MMTEKTTKAIYHERQRKHLCALHVLNNLLQKEEFTQANLDEICTRLTPQNYFNPHRSMFGLGNYDVNVVTAALQSRGLNVVWFDKRKEVEQIDFTKIEGVILNVPSGFLKLPIDLNFKHWIVIRAIGGVFYNLDSKLSKPEEIGKAEDLVYYLMERILQKKTQMLLVVEPEVDQSRSWYRTSKTDQKNEEEFRTSKSVDGTGINAESKEHENNTQSGNGTVKSSHKEKGSNATIHNGLQSEMNDT